LLNDLPHYAGILVYLSTARHKLVRKLICKFIRKIKMKFRKPLLVLIVTGLFSANAFASIDLIAIGTLSGSTDLSGLTAPLENGLTGNILGGMGSGFAWAGGNTFIATPDRGPNATTYNTLVNDTSSYISRFQTLTMNLTANTGAGLAFNLTPTLTATTLLSSATPLNYGTGAGLGNKIDGVTPIGSGAPSINTSTTNYFTGRSDNYAAGLSTNPNNARLDPEGVRVSNDGKSIFVSDEYGPYVYQFNRATGERIKSFELPTNLAIANLSAVGASEIANNTTGRVANKGMEGLAITPDGKTLVGIMQAPLLQDDKKQVRIVTIDIATGAIKEIGYRLTTGSGVSEIVALNDHQFIVDERDGNGLGAGNATTSKGLYQIDITGATDISNVVKMTSTTPAVNKVLFQDLVGLFVANGISNSMIPAKIEGLAFGEDVLSGGIMKHTLFITNDNDFVAGVAGDNKFYVLSFTDADLATGFSYTAQNLSVAAVPEPETFALMLAGLGLIGFAARRKQKASA
jgi:hypothetical protein